MRKEGRKEEIKEGGDKRALRRVHEAGDKQSEKRRGRRKGLKCKSSENKKF